MPPRHRRLGAAGRSRGFALIVVLWVFVLIAFIVAHVTASGRTELRIAANLAANAAGQAAADGAIYQAIFNQLDPSPSERWPLDSSVHQVEIGNSRVTLLLADEAARINPNLASPALLQALLDAVTSNREQAAELAAAIAEWTGAKKGPRSLSGIDADYRTAGLNYSPPGEPLHSLDELGRVKGMTPELLEALRPHLTLFGPAVPSADGDDPVVARAVAEAARTGPAAPPLALADASGVITARINATAKGPAGATANRIAIARIGPGLPHGYALLSWESSAE